MSLDWRTYEIERERRHAQQVDDLLVELADEIATYRGIWNWGDGDGGYVIERLRALLEERGIDRYVPTPRKKRGQLSPGVRYRIMERDAFVCLRCGVQTDLTIDHIQPVDQGGSDDPENLQTLCRSCNSSKGTKTIGFGK